MPKNIQKKIVFLKVAAMLAVIIFLLSGCGQSSQKPTPGQSQQTGRQPDKVPDQLKSIEESIEEIIKNLNGPAVILKEEKFKAGQGQDQKHEQGGLEQQKAQSGSQGDQSGQGGQGGQGGRQSQGTKPGETAQQPKQQDPWEKITPMINSLHYQWNSYMPSAVKKGANKTTLDNFGNALNSLTLTIISKNSTNVLMAASYLYAYVPDFFSLYRTLSSPEVKRIRYYTRNAMLNAMTANWVQADHDINSLKSSWSLYKNSIDREHQDISNKLDFSIYELDKVVKERSQPLVDIKGRVAISNIEALEKAFEKSGEMEQLTIGQAGGG